MKKQERVKNKQVKVLFVCMGNICRSPTAHGVFEKLVNDEQLENKIEIESAGTHAYHVGNGPDPRAQQTAAGHEVDLSHILSRQVNDTDFSYYDYILAMDNDNYSLLEQSCPDEYLNKLSLFMDYAPHLALSEVPDPYYGGVRGFENVFNMVNEASKGLLEVIKVRHFS
jgi:protein-tyrosine phosphatase